MTSAFGVVFKKGRGCVDLTDMGKGEEGVTIIDIIADVIYNWPLTAWRAASGPKIIALLSSLLFLGSWEKVRILAHDSLNRAATP